MNYKSMKGINQSSLKEILKSPGAYQKALEKSESTEKHFLLGSLVDEMLLEEDPEYIDKHYYRAGELSVSDAIKDIVKYVFDKASLDSSSSFELLDDYILEGCNIYNWNSKWGDAAKLKNVKAQGTAYFNLLKESQGKTIITEAEYLQAMTAKMSILQDPYIKKFFIENENQSVLKKHVLTFEYRNNSCKGEVDLIVIDRKHKIIHPFDVKTISMATNYFPINFWKFRYDFQAAFYTEGIRRSESLQKYIKDGYSVGYFKFIVVDLNATSYPLIYKMTSEVLNIGIYGGTLKNGKEIEGVKQAFDRLNFHLEKQEFTYPKEYYSGPINIEI